MCIKLFQMSFIHCIFILKIFMHNLVKVYFFFLIIILLSVFLFIFRVTLIKLEYISIRIININRWQLNRSKLSFIRTIGFTIMLLYRWSYNNLFRLYKWLCFSISRWLNISKFLSFKFNNLSGFLILLFI